MLSTLFIFLMLSSNAESQQCKVKLQATSSLKIFVSSSMPKESLRALYQQAATIGARLIFRGLINNSFQDTQAYFKELSIAADIDPTQFETYHITQVPTFVMGEHQLQGNISVTEALSHLKREPQS